MDSLKNIPSFKARDLTLGETALTVTSLGKTEDAATAWAWLPSGGEGVVVFADRICRFEQHLKPALLLDAEVSEGDSTVVIRASAGSWYGWRWSESPGKSHRFVDHTFESSERRERTPYHQYRQYWHPVKEDDIPVWRPVGARFLGFLQEGK